MCRQLLFLLMLPGISLGQVNDTLTLDECHELAVTANPAYVQMHFLDLQHQLNVKNVKTGWYPSLDLNGSYTWQSEVVELASAIPIPGFDAPLMPHYNYKLTLDLHQTLYDGGFAAAQNKLENSLHDVNRQQVEVELYQVHQQVNNVFFYMLILQQQKNALEITKEELSARKDIIESCVKNGVLMATDSDVIEAEMIKVDQQLREISISRESALEILGTLIGQKVNKEIQLVEPAVEVKLEMEVKRPEYQLFDLQLGNLDASKQIAITKRRPKVFVFGTLGYGNPALNFFKDEFRSYYIVGAGLNWNIWDWSKTSRERQILDIQQDIVKSRKDAFDQVLDITLEEEIANVRKYEESVMMDEEIVTIRKRVTKNAASQLENGIITSTDYVSVLNAETQARIQLETHKILLLQAKVNLLTKKGNI